MSNQSEKTTTKPGVSRRTVVKGTAWAVPAVVVATAAPAMAAGASQCATPSFGGSSCKQPGAGKNADGYSLDICFSNACSTAITVQVVAVVSKSSGVRQNYTTATLNVPANGSACYPNNITYCNTNSGNFLKVIYKVNGGPEITSNDIPSPPDCAATVPPLCGA